MRVRGGTETPQTTLAFFPFVDSVSWRGKGGVSEGAVMRHGLENGKGTDDES